MIILSKSQLIQYSIPLDIYDLTGLGPYTSTQIDTWFNGIADLGAPYPTFPDVLIVVGQANPTSLSATARNITLADNYVPIIYNEGYNPN